MSERREELIPALGVVTEIRKDTPDVKTFRVVTPDGKKAFEHKPGQCAMLSVPGVGEGMFSITSSPTQEEYMEFSIKKCGCLTSWLHPWTIWKWIPGRYRVKGQKFAVYRRWYRTGSASFCNQLLSSLS